MPLHLLLLHFIIIIMSLRTPEKRKRRKSSHAEGSNLAGQGSSGSTSKTRPVDGYKTDGGVYPNPSQDATLIQLKEALLENAVDSVTPKFTVQAALGEIIRYFFWFV